MGTAETTLQLTLSERQTADFEMIGNGGFAPLTGPMGSADWKRSVEEMREHVGATSLAYLSLEGMHWATRLPEESVCNACFTRSYPTRVPDERLVSKHRFELPVGA